MKAREEREGPKDRHRGEIRTRPTEREAVKAKITENPNLVRTKQTTTKWFQTSDCTLCRLLGSSTGGVGHENMGCLLQQIAKALSFDYMSDRH